eukprot:364975-Chlamydomonas_euryale.AAC.11
MAAVASAYGAPPQMAALGAPRGGLAMRHGAPPGMAAPLGGQLSGGYGDIGGARGAARQMPPGFGGGM